VQQQYIQQQQVKKETRKRVLLRGVEGLLNTLLLYRAWRPFFLASIKNNKIIKIKIDQQEIVILDTRF